MSGGIKLVKFPAGETIFFEGERTYCFYIVKEGHVEIVKENELKETKTLAVLGDGQSFGEFAMINSHPRSATAIAKTDVVLVKISDGAYKAMLQEVPTWVQSLLDTLVERVKIANEIIFTKDPCEKAEDSQERYMASQFNVEGARSIEVEKDFAKIPDLIPEQVEKHKKAS